MQVRPLGARRGVAWVLAATCLVPACDDLHASVSGVTREATGNVSLATPGSVAAVAPNDGGRKLDRYLGCTRRMGAHIDAAWLRRVARIPEGQALAPHETRPVLDGADDVLSDCEGAMATGASTGPSGPDLDDAMAEYLKAAKVIAGAPDDFAGHYDSWVEAERVVDRGLLALVEQASGRGLEWLTLQTLVAARHTMRCIAARHSTAEGCRDPRRALRKSANELDAYHRAHASEVDGTPGARMRESALRDYGAKLDELLRDAGEGTLDRDRIRSVVDEYNDLIGDSNNLHSG